MSFFNHAHIIYSKQSERTQTTPLMITIEKQEEQEELSQFQHFKSSEESQEHPTSIFGNVCSEDDLRSRIFGTFVVKFLACLLLLGFSNI